MAFASMFSQLNVDAPGVRELNVNAPGVRSDASDNASSPNATREDVANAYPSSRSLPKTTRHRNKEHLSSFKRSRASFAAAILLIRITCASPSRRRSVAKSVMSTRCLFAERTTAKPTAPRKSAVVAIERAGAHGGGKKSMVENTSRHWQGRSLPRRCIKRPSLIAIVCVHRFFVETQLTMTSLKQIEANRLNALKSTGPKTAAGKRRAR